VSQTAAAWIDRIVGILVEEGYEIGASTVGSSMLATRRVRGLGPFFPCTDFFFIHHVTAQWPPERFEQLHQLARIYAEEQFRLPRVLRYHIPNTVSVGVSDSGFSAETLAFAQSSKLRSPLVGGEKDSTYLFDVAAKELLSQGVETTPGRYGARVESGVNPTNRTYELMTRVYRRLLQG